MTIDPKSRFIEHIYSVTNPIKPHEAEAISSILGFKYGQHLWRVRKNHFCCGCRCELSVLDYFLSSLRKHNLDFLRKQIIGDLDNTIVAATANQFTTSLEGTEISIASHSLDITCMKCGSVNFGIDPDAKHTLEDGGSGGGYVRYFYVHPGDGGKGGGRQQGATQTIRIGTASFFATLDALGLPNFLNNTPKSG